MPTYQFLLWRNGSVITTPTVRFQQLDGLSYPFYAKADVTRPESVFYRDEEALMTALHIRYGDELHHIIRVIKYE